MRYVLIVFFFLSIFSNSSGQSISETRKIKIAKGARYLNLPVNSHDPEITMRIVLDGKVLDRFTIRLAQKTPEYWTFFDVDRYNGKTLAIQVEGPVPGPEAKSSSRLTAINAATTFPGQDSLYREKGRPQVHFSSQRGWINDPNGLILHEGEYHLYFQHNPYGWPWGNMHWGHAVSPDLLHWQQLSEAIFPVVKEGVVDDAAFSGSAITDPENTGGFRKNGIDPIIAFYTSTGRGECIQVSYDKGRTFEDYAGNPVVKHRGEGRDPKVFWYAPGKHWVMAVWDASVPKKLSQGEEVLVREHSIYTSTDLKKWNYESGVEGFFECPELFEIPVAGKAGVNKWVMYDANGRYVVGLFDGKKFTVEQPFTQYEHGGGIFYASQTYYNAPEGKRIQVGWARDITHPGMPFNQAMLFPTELKLKATPFGYRLCPTPIPAISTLHAKSDVVENKLVTESTPLSATINAEDALHVIAEIERGNAPIIVNVMGYELKFDNEWSFTATPADAPDKRSQVTYVPTDNVFKVEVIVDKTMLEFFVNDGELYYTTPFNGKKTNTIEISVGKDKGRKVNVRKLAVHTLNSTWKK